MPAPQTIQQIAQRAIELHGPNAETYALDMFHDSLERDALREAGAWLIVAHTINDLERLPPPGKRH
jgi:hypothetical protein